MAIIKAQRDLLMEYLERSFDEGAKNFSQMFDVGDRAIAKRLPWRIATGNNQQLALILDSITRLAQSSPFQDLANLQLFAIKNTTKLKRGDRA